MSMSMAGDDSRPILLSVEDVPRELQIGKSFYYNLARDGKGPTLTKLGDRTFVSRENLEADRK